MAERFHVSIAVPSRIAYEGESSSLVVPAQMGYLGVLAHHAPIIAQLKPGTIRLKDPHGKILNFHLESNGFLEFYDNKATLMLDSLELPS